MGVGRWTPQGIVVGRGREVKASLVLSVVCFTDWRAVDPACMHVTVGGQQAEDEAAREIKIV